MVLKVKVDTREKEKNVRVLRSFGVQVERTKLDCFDLETDKVGIEVKSVADLLASLQARRLWSQLERMSQTDKQVKVLAINGAVENLYNYDTLNWKVVYGGLASAAVRYGVHIFWVNDDRKDRRRFYYSLIGIMKKVDEKKLGVPRRVYMKREHSDPRVVALCRLLGVPVSTAKAILKRFKTVRDFLLAGDQDWMCVPGIGPVRARKLKKLLRGDKPI